MRNSYLDTVNFFKEIDDNAALVNSAKDRHYKRYSILGTYVWPNPAPYAKTYAEENRNMKNWIKARLAWLDANILPYGVCNWITTGDNIDKSFSLLNVSAYPNPFTKAFVVSMKINKSSSYNIELYNINGQVIRQIKTDLLIPDEYNFYIDDVISIPTGIYLLRISAQDGSSKTIKLVKS